MVDWEAFYNSFRKPGFVPGYEIQNRLGGGAFGDVYKARKTSIGKAFAVKFLKLENDNQREAVERELSHVRHFAAIDHPNLVTIEDMGTVMGVPFLIMGYAGEETLAKRLRQGTLEVQEALRVFVQVCRGVLALHDRRLVHFDLKPSNVFLKGDVARVGDYGLSKLLTDGRTTLSFGRGTPHYMAPEMLKGRADHRADLYSLGVILYESLAGSLPYRPHEDAGLVLRETDEPPEFPEDFPAALRPAIEGCLRLDPADRYAGVGELLDDLGQTARPGDSVVFDPEALARRAAAATHGAPARSEAAASPAASVGGSAAPAPAGGSGPAAAPRGTPGSGSSSELRQTAVDLARGATVAARGLLEGLRGGEAASSAGPTGPAARRDAGAEVREVTTPPSPARAGGERVGRDLRRAGEDLREAASVLGAGMRRVRDGVTQGRGKVRPEAEAKARTLVAGLGLGDEEPAPAPAGEGPVPVPPRVEGGLVGTLVSTLLVGLEVLGALVGGLLRGLTGLFTSIVAHLTERTGGLVSRVARMALFLALMAGLGFAVMLVGMVFLDAVGARSR